MIEIYEVFFKRRIIVNSAYSMIQGVCLSVSLYGAFHFIHANWHLLLKKNATELLMFWDKLRLYCYFFKT